MIMTNVSKEGVNIAITGSINEIITDVIFIISETHAELAKQDEDACDNFKRMIQEVVKEKFVWIKDDDERCEEIQKATKRVEKKSEKTLSEDLKKILKILEELDDSECE